MVYTRGRVFFFVISSLCADAKVPFFVIGGMFAFIDNTSGRGHEHVLPGSPESLKAFLFWLFISPTTGFRRDSAKFSVCCVLPFRTLGPRTTTSTERWHPDRRSGPVPSFLGALWFERHDLAINSRVSKRACDLSSCDLTYIQHLTSTRTQQAPTLSFPG